MDLGIISATSDYMKGLNFAMQHLDLGRVMDASDILINAYEKMENILICGNGGSAAIAEHWTCDHSKGVSMDTKFTSLVHCLNNNSSLMTAIANDIGYEHVFAKQIDWFPGSEILIVISSSGNSPNIIKALETANGYMMKTIALVGFDGGKVLANNLAKTIIHVNSNNYGIVEDSHQIIMHILAQHIRSKFAVDPESLKL